MLKERIAHMLVGSPVEGMASRLRNLNEFRKARRKPEIADALLEAIYFPEIFREFVRDGMNCVDVGAHLGVVLSEFLRLSPTGRHTAIEPTPHKAEWLRRKFGMSSRTRGGVRIEQVAVADTAGMVKFIHIPKASAYSGLRLQKEAIGERPKVVEIEVNQMRLDELLQDKVDFLKVDVEGAELLAFRGAESIFRRQRPPMLFECTQNGLDAFGFEAQEIYDLLVGEYGYRLYPARPRRRRGEPLDAETFARGLRYPFLAFNFLALPVP